jgi:hypothetical protein
MSGENQREKHGICQWDLSEVAGEEVNVVD